MFLIRKPIWLIHVGGQVIRTTADHPFFIQGKGWTDTAKLQVGDLLRSDDGQEVPIEGITDSGEEAVVYQMGVGVPPFPFTGLWRAGTLLETADGLKPIEDIKTGDYLVVRPPPDADEGPHDEDERDEDDEEDDRRRWENN